MNPLMQILQGLGGQGGMGLLGGQGGMSPFGGGMGFLSMLGGQQEQGQQNAGFDPSMFLNPLFFKGARENNPFVNPLFNKFF